MNEQHETQAENESNSNKFEIKNNNNYLQWINFHSVFVLTRVQKRPHLLSKCEIICHWQLWMSHCWDKEKTIQQQQHD